MNKKQYEKVEQILEKAAKFNGVLLGSDPLGVKGEMGVQRQLSEVSHGKTSPARPPPTASWT